MLRVLSHIHIESPYCLLIDLYRSVCTPLLGNISSRLLNQFVIYCHCNLIIIHYLIHLNLVYEKIYQSALFTWDLDYLSDLVHLWRVGGSASTTAEIPNFKKCLLTFCFWTANVMLSDPRIRLARTNVSRSSGRKRKDNFLMELFSMLRMCSLDPS